MQVETQEESNKFYSSIARNTNLQKTIVNDNNLIHLSLLIKRKKLEQSIWDEQVANLNKFVSESNCGDINKKCSLYLRLQIYLFCVTMNL